MKTILFTNARDEADILEWAVHHTNLGFDKIYITDHKSLTPIRDIVGEIPNICVRRLECDCVLKNNLITEAVKYATEHQYDWMLYLDADELLILPKDANVQTFLHKFNDYDMIGMNWLLFGSNYHNQKPAGTILKNYTRCETQFNVHIKSFVRPLCVLRVPADGGPHVYTIREFDRAVGTNKIPMIKAHPHFFNQLGHMANVEQINQNDAYVAHHIFQCFETYQQRKVFRKRDDNNEDWSWKFDENELHKHYNHIENRFPCEKYNKKNIETMELYKKTSR
jgi:hypothetical protein